MKKHPAALAASVFFLGIGLLLYPAFSRAWNQRTQTRAITRYQDAVSQERGDTYAACFQAAEAYNEALRSLEDPFLFSGTVSGYEDLLHVGAGGIMGYVTVPKIDVELPIYHGTSQDVLSAAAGHVQGSSLPTGGSGTHCVISAHRGTPSARLFTDLDRLEPGDTFSITVLDRVLTYQVDQIRTVDPRDTSDLIVIPGEDHCTLMTCTPYGINSHRLLVRGTRAEAAAEREQSP